MQTRRAQQIKDEPTPKEPYVPPKATFVALKLEERLLSCKTVGTGCGAYQAS
jgi:hypothetical protein